MKKLLYILSLLLCNGLVAQREIVVAQDGSGQYRTVQAALDAIPLHNTRPVTVFVKNGMYREKLHLDSTKDFVTLEGQDKFNTVLTYDDHTGTVAANGTVVNTRTSWSCRISAADFTARDLTIRNNAGFTAGQAVALETDGDRATYINCRFIGFQDVLFTNNPQSRQYFSDCYIEGTTDFIFGSATCWFEHCHIHSKKNSHVTAASTPADHPFGYVFDDCVLTGDTSLHGVSLGRPWRPYASVSYLHCYLGPQIRPDGWSNWNQTDNFKTARYSEFENYGPGAAVAGRAPWSRQLTAAEAAGITMNKVLNGWQPKDCNFKR